MQESIESRPARTSALALGINKTRSEQKRIVVEVVQFKLNEGVPDEAFITEAGKVQESFLKNQKGYLDRELLKDENGQWFDILHWASMEEGQGAWQVVDVSCEEVISPNTFYIESVAIHKSNFG